MRGALILLLHLQKIILVLYPASSPGYPMTEAQERASWSLASTQVDNEDSTPTVMDYLTRAEPELIKCVEEWRWFDSLRYELKKELPSDLDTFRLKGVKAHFDHVMTQAWYNFDILAKPRRPIKSYQRMKRDFNRLVECGAGYQDVARVCACGHS